MAFLRVDRGRIAARKRDKAHHERKLAAEAQAFVSQPKPKPQLLGRTFTTKKAAVEYGKRCLDGGWRDGEVTRENTSPRKPIKERWAGAPMSPARAHDSQLFSKGAGKHSIRVRPVNGVWRRYVESGSGWRWVSDHASMDNALSGHAPLNEPE